MLTLQDKADIYDLLKLGFKEEERIPLASVAQYLNSRKFSYQEYGYKKLKSLLADLSFLSCETDKKNHNACYVILHPFDSKEKEMTPLGKKEKPKKKQVLDEKTKKKIETLLLEEYEMGKSYPLSAVSKYLVENKIDYKALGFSKMRKLLESLNEILTLSEDKNNKSVVSVNFLVLKKKNTASRKKENKSTDHSTKEDTPLPEPKKDCFFTPDNLLLSIKEFTPLGLDDDAIRNQLLEDYRNAYQKKDFRVKEDAYLFPLSFKSKEGDALIASIRKAGKGASYKYYLNYVGTDREKAGDVLSDTIYFEDIDKELENLSRLARKEDWCYHNSKDKYIILRIYLQYTFYQVMNQNKLVFDPTSHFGCFNTGLKTKDYEDIYGIVKENDEKSIPQKYLFQGFSIAASQGLGKIIVEHFNPLPQKATYIHSADDLVFDPTSPIHTDARHIILDNIDRFPLSFLKAILLPFKEENRLLSQIEKEKSNFSKERLFERLEKCIEQNDTLFTLLKVSLDAAIAKAIRMVSYDYRNALPSFFPTRNVMSLMLPLEFTSEDKVEAVLLIEKTPSGNYQGQTILTLKQCYVNARLISPLENSFLKAGNIED